MAWANETLGTLGVFESSKKMLEGICLDLAQAVNRLNESIDGTEEKRIAELLFYVDSTNASVYISGYFSEQKQTDDVRMVIVRFEELLYDDYEAYDFDDLISSAVRIILETELGRKLKLRFIVWFQDEEDEAKRIR